MTAFRDLPVMARGTVSVFSVLLFLLTVYVLIRRISYRIRWQDICLFGILAAGEYILRCIILFDTNPGVIRGVYPAFVSLGALPWVAVAAVLLALFAVNGFSFVLLRRTESVTLSPNAVKECIDCLPVGLCFCRKNGSVLMANEKMEQLCFLVTGQSLLNGKQLWETLKQGQPKTGTSAYIKENAAVFICEDGTTVNFARVEMPYEKKTVYQLMAVDITERYHLSAELNLEVERLQEMNDRLRNYGDAVAATVREEEMLAAKAGIHDRLGRALIAGRLYAEQRDSALPPEELLHVWREVVGLMRHESEPDTTIDPVEELSAAAALVGVTVRTVGSLPRSDRAMRLMISGAMECVNNAARHAGASELTVSMEQTTDNYRFIYTNNGAAPTKPVTEGGGLSELRRRAERFGGTMRIYSFPEFSLELTIPR